LEQAEVDGKAQRRGYKIGHSLLDMGFHRSLMKTDTAFWSGGSRRGSDPLVTSKYIHVYAVPYSSSLFRPKRHVLLGKGGRDRHTSFHHLSFSLLLAARRSMGQSIEIPAVFLFLFYCPSYAPWIFLSCALLSDHQSSIIADQRGGRRG